MEVERDPPRPPVEGRPGAVRALVVIAAALAVFFAPAVFTADQFLYRDSGRMHWPVKRYVAEQLRAGHLPEWNPYLGLGVPIVAGAVDAVQHPFNALLVALPFEIGFKLWILLSYALAATGGYAWARRLGRSWSASVAAGLAFALSGFLVSSSDNITYLTTLAALPWLFAAAHAWLERGGAGRLALVGLASGLCAAGGDPQAWGFGVVALPLYALLIAGAGRGWLARLRRGAAATLAAFVGAAPFILPVLAWMPHSSRGGAVSEVEIARWNLPPLRLLEMALPHMFRDQEGTLGSWVYIAFGGGELTPIPWVLSIYVGASVIALALLGSVRSARARWLSLGAMVLGWMALGIHGGFGRLLPHLPVLRGFRYWEKMAVWPSLLLAVAAAHGIDALAKEDGRGRRRFTAAIGAAAALALALSGLLAAAPGWAARLLARPPSSAEAAPVFAQAARSFAANLRDGLLETGVVCAVLGLVLLVTRRGALRPVGPALLALVVVFDLAAANVRGYTLADPYVVQTRAPFGDYLRSQPGLQRVFTRYDLSNEGWHGLREFEAGLIRGAHLLEASANVSYRVGNFLAYAGMVPARTERFNMRSGFARQIPHVGILGVGYFAVPGSTDRAREWGLPPPYSVAAVDPLVPALLLRVPHRERAYLAGELSTVDRRHAMEFLLDVDPSRTERSVVEGPVPADYRPPRGTARIVTDLPERVAVETDADGTALLVLNDVHAAGWTGAVDGRPAEILPANYMARGVWVGAGRHLVTFTYRTAGLREGWAIFLAGALVLSALALRERRRARASAT
ncbi:MAG TPA: hypothetical protein VIW03_06925 [Anaeromyxobacter sp.]